MVFGRLQRGSVGGGCDATGEALLGPLGTGLRAALFANLSSLYLTFGPSSLCVFLAWGYCMALGDFDCLLAWCVRSARTAPFGTRSFRAACSNEPIPLAPALDALVT